jgi:hypothetical protein
MRYIRARQAHKCAVCGETIKIGQVCIQSQKGWGHFYHDECHTERFGASAWHMPKNKLEEVEAKD